MTDQKTIEERVVANGPQLPDAEQEVEKTEDPLYENARLIGYFRMARLKFLVTPILFSLVFIAKSIKAATYFQAITATEITDILICLALGISGYLCWRSLIKVESALVRTTPDATGKVLHTICVCHLFTFLIATLGGLRVYHWLADYQLMGSILGGLTAFFLIFKLLMIEKAVQIVRWFSSPSGLSIYPLEKRTATPQSIRRILFLIYLYTAAVYALIAFRLFGM